MNVYPCDNWSAAFKIRAQRLSKYVQDEVKEIVNCPGNPPSVNIQNTNKLYINIYSLSEAVLNSDGIKLRANYTRLR